MINLKKIFIRSIFLKLLVKLNLTDKILSLYFRRDSKNNYEDGRIPLPELAHFEPTIRCNLKCRICHQTERRENSKGELSYNSIKKVLSNIKQCGIKKLELIGGEIFLRKDIIPILKFISDNSMSVKIGTNATLLSNGKIGILKKFKGIESLTISIDGLEKNHNMLRNAKDAFQKAIKAISHISRADFMSVIYFVIQDRNIGDIPEIIKLAKEYHVDRITFMPEIFSLPSEKTGSAKLIGEKDVEFFLNTVKESPFSVEELINAIKSIKQERKKYGVFAPVYPDFALKYPREYVEGTIRNKFKVFCKQFNTVTINESGELMICPFMNLTFGNLTETPLNQLWNSKKTVDFRRKLISVNFLPICSRCCALTIIDSKN